jgi:RNA polymerase sigma-70 factor (ECF subfamily)
MLDDADLVGRAMLDDADLVGKARAGDRQAFLELALRHESLLRALCARVVGHAGLTDDAIQEALVQAMTSLHRLRRPERFGPWLAGIGLNVSRRMVRGELGPAARVDPLGGVYDAVASPAPEPHELAEQAELASAVRSAVMALPTGQRAATLLFYLGGLSQAEVADTLGIRVSAVKTRLFKARQSLQRELLDLWKEDYMNEAPVVEVEVADVRTTREEDQHRYLLLIRQRGSASGFPIWVGMPEGAAIAALLEHERTPRPMTYALAADAIHALGGTVTGCTINGLTEDVFYATLSLSGPSGEAHLDARPSDAIALALADGAPITADAAMFQRIAEEHPEAEWERSGAAEVVAAVRELARPRRCQTEPPE